MTTDYRNQNLQGRSFAGQTLEDVDFSGADLRGADFSGAKLRNVNFQGAKFGRNIRGTLLMLGVQSSIEIVLALFNLMAATLTVGFLQKLLTDLKLSSTGFDLLLIVTTFIFMLAICGVVLISITHRTWKVMYWFYGLIVTIAIVVSLVDGTGTTLPFSIAALGSAIVALLGTGIGTIGLTLTLLGLGAFGAISKNSAVFLSLFMWLILGAYLKHLATSSEEPRLIYLRRLAIVRGSWFCTHFAHADFQQVDFSDVDLRGERWLRSVGQYFPFLKWKPCG